jgi:hypothetical protein
MQLLVQYLSLFKDDLDIMKLYGLYVASSNFIYSYRIVTEIKLPSFQKAKHHNEVNKKYASLSNTAIFHNVGTVYKKTFWHCL